MLRRIVLEEMNIGHRTKRRKYSVSDLLDESFDILNVRDSDLFPTMSSLSELYSPPAGDELERMIKQRATAINKKKRGKIEDVMPIARREVEAEIAREKAESDELDAERFEDLNKRKESEDFFLDRLESSDDAPSTPGPKPPKAEDPWMTIITNRAEAERKRREAARKGKKDEQGTAQPPRRDVPPPPERPSEVRDDDVETGGEPGTNMDADGSEIDEPTHGKDKIRVDARIASDYIDRHAELS